jgi:hypothetical protein
MGSGSTEENRLPRYGYATFSSIAENPSQGEELGWLYATAPIVNDSAPTSPVEISAHKIADEIIACRKKSGIYSGRWYGGSFKSWRQFHAFCDGLVWHSETNSIGLLCDKRQIFYDFRPAFMPYPPDLMPMMGTKSDYSAMDDPHGWPAQAEASAKPILISSSHGQPWPQNLGANLASRALGDLLKANFNPNLHLNETNPDTNLCLMLDKTDLVVQSTEFCFTPMGIFQMESLGRLLKLQSGSDLLAPGAESRVIAEARVETLVQLYQVLRHSTQKDFYVPHGERATRLGAGVATFPCTSRGLPSERRRGGWARRPGSWPGIRDKFPRP